MKLLVFAAGVFVGLTFNRIPHYTRGVWTSNPPDTPAGYSPRYRNWIKGVEV